VRHRERKQTGPANRRRYLATLELRAALAFCAAVAPAFALDACGGGTHLDARAAQTPTLGAVYKDGPSGRYLLAGTWLLRFDGGVGLRDRFEDSISTTGWKSVRVPTAWNAGQQTTASYQPNVAWYRKDFVLPSSAPRYTWIVRFESINNSVTIWLNGHEIARHTRAFLAFEVPLPANALNPTAVNRLVLRVSDAHSAIDLPPLNETESTKVAGGWWNYGGLLREVYLRPVQTIDFQSVQVPPHLACASCAAKISYTVVPHNYAQSAQRVSLRTSYGGTVAALGCSCTSRRPQTRG